MSHFSSDREQCLWFLVLLVVVAIYATLGLTGTLAQELRERNLLAASFALGFILIIVAITGSAVITRPGWRWIWISLGVVAILVYQALTERVRNGRKVPVPAILAMVVTAIFGWVDESIQALLPNRVFDVRDIGFNALAGLMAITASVVLNWVSWRGNKLRD